MAIGRASALMLAREGAQSGQRIATPVRWKACEAKIHVSTPRCWNVLEDAAIGALAKKLGAIGRAIQTAPAMSRRARSWTA